MNFSPPSKATNSRSGQTRKPAEPPFGPLCARDSDSPKKLSSVTSRSPDVVRDVCEVSSSWSTPSDDEPAPPPQRPSGRRKPAGRKAKAARGRIVSGSEQSDSSASEGQRKSQHKDKLRPFPMATQMLESLEPSPVKRGSSESVASSDEEARERKRARGGEDMYAFLNCFLSSSHHTITQLERAHALR